MLYVCVVVVEVNKRKATYSCVCPPNRGTSTRRSSKWLFVDRMDHRPKFAVNEVGLRTQPKPITGAARPTTAVTAREGNGELFQAQLI